MSGVVFNAFAVTNFAQHFQIKTGALFNALGLDQLAFADELLDAFHQFQLDGFHGDHDLVAGRHIVTFWVDDEARNLLPNASGQRVKQLQRFDFVVKQLNPNGQF